MPVNSPFLPVFFLKLKILFYNPYGSAKGQEAKTFLTKNKKVGHMYD